MFNCAYGNHQNEEITGICLQGCDQRPWICMRCIIEKHKNHQDKCKTFSQIITLIEDACHHEVRRQQNETIKIEQLIAKSKSVVQEVEKNIQIYNQWIFSIKEQMYKNLDIKSLIDTLNNIESYGVVKEMVKQGQRLLGQNQYFESLDLFEKSFVIDSKNVDSLNGKGQCLLLLTRYESAQKCFDQVLSDDPNNMQALFGKGECLRMIDNDREAVNIYNKILQQDPNHTQSLISKASCLRHLKRPDEAIKYLDGNTWQAQFEKGHCLKQKKKYQEALVCFRKALKLNPDDDEIKNEIQYCLNPYSQ